MNVIERRALLVEGALRRADVVVSSDDADLGPSPQPSASTWKSTGTEGRVACCRISGPDGLDPGGGEP
jgi:hypothetical protein